MTPHQPAHGAAIALLLLLATSAACQSTRTLLQDPQSTATFEEYKQLMTQQTNPFRCTGPSTAGNVLMTELGNMLRVGLAAVPEVGIVLNLFSGWLWPDIQAWATGGSDPNADPKADCQWAAIQQYVQSYVGAALDTAQLNTLSNMVAGYRDTISLYYTKFNNTDASVDKSGAFTAILEIMRTDSPQFSNAATQMHPASVLPYLVTFGTMHLVWEREQYLFSSHIHPGTTDKNPADLKAFELYLSRYTDAAAGIRNASTTWREAQLTTVDVTTGWCYYDSTTCDPNYGCIPAKQNYECGDAWAQDTNPDNPWSGTRYHFSDCCCGPAPGGDDANWHSQCGRDMQEPTARQKAQADQDWYRGNAMGTFNGNLDTTLGPVAEWQNMIPATTSRRRVLATGSAAAQRTPMQHAPMLGWPTKDATSAMYRLQHMRPHSEL